MRTLTILALVLLIPSIALGMSCISGTVTVEPAAIGSEFEGYWCYTMTVTWDSPQSLSHLDVFIGLEGLECACDPGLFAFPDPAGTTTGVEDGVECTLEHLGEYKCTGDPSLPSELENLAAVKFEPISEPCDAGSVGSGTFTFYSLLAPTSWQTHPDALVVKNGQIACMGNLDGQLPTADCAVEHTPRSFGTVKSQFED